MRLCEEDALAAGGVLATVAVAAADIDATDFPFAEVPSETNPYADGWFIGNNGGGVVTPAWTQDEAGLEISGCTLLLYGGVVEFANGAAFEELTADAAIDADGATYFQFPMFVDGANNAGFTTIRPALAGTPAVDGDWISSWDIKVGDEIVVPKNTPVSLGALVDAFDQVAEAGLAPELLAAGFLVDKDVTATVRSVTFLGDTYHFDAMPEVEEPGEGEGEPGEGEGEPGTEEPGTEEPGTEEPVTEEPGTEPAPATPIEKDATFAG